MIRVKDLTKNYGPRVAIDHLCFEIEAGEIVGFLGPNGAGKSTTMKILTGFMPASSGSAEIAGFDVFLKSQEVKKRVGFLPENPPLYLEMTTYDYLRFAGEIHGCRGAELSRLVDQVVEQTGLQSVRRRIIGNLSKGYRQRIGLAQALLPQPEVLILDEPTVGLDPQQIREIRTVIKNLAGNHTVILSSHILPEVTATCQRIIVINQGKIVAEDSIEGLNRQFHHGNQYRLKLGRATPEMVQIISVIAGVDNVGLENDTLKISISKNAPEIRPQIVRTAVEAGMDVLDFSTEEVSLEDIFLQLTTQESEGAPHA